MPAFRFWPWENGYELAQLRAVYEQLFQRLINQLFQIMLEAKRKNVWYSFFVKAGKQLLFQKPDINLHFASHCFPFMFEFQARN